MIAHQAQLWFTGTGTDAETVVYRAAVDRAVGLAASLIFWDPGGKRPGPGAQSAPKDPGGPP